MNEGEQHRLHKLSDNVFKEDFSESILKYKLVHFED